MLGDLTIDFFFVAMQSLTHIDNFLAWIKFALSYKFLLLLVNYVYVYY
jgi:hypothetical protein